MSAPLDTAFTALAEEAGAYADPDRAIRAARRSRRNRFLITPLILVVVFALAAFGAVKFIPDRSPAPPAKPPTYPSMVDTPDANTPELPDKPVGRGVFVYSPKTCEGCPVYLVTGSGKQYRLPAGGNVDSSYSDALSPDGRWLYYHDKYEPVLRDLVKGREVRPNDKLGEWSRFQGWSADGKWLLTHVTQGLEPYGLYDPSTGEHRRVRIGDAAWKPLIVLSANEMVVGPSRSESNFAPSRSAEPLRVIRPSTGERIRDLPVDVSALLKEGESITTWTGLLIVSLRAHGQELLIPLISGGNAAILVSLEDGHAITRYDLPPDNVDNWAIVSFTGADVIAGREGSGLELVLINSVTGERRTATTFPPGAHLSAVAVSG